MDHTQVLCLTLNLVNLCSVKIHNTESDPSLVTNIECGELCSVQIHKNESDISLVANLNVNFCTVHATMGQIQGMVTRGKNKKRSLFLQKNCDPKFLKTIGFGDMNGVDTSTRVRLTVYNVKERMTGTVSTHFHQILWALSFFHIFSLLPASKL